MGGRISAWEAVERRQRQTAQVWWLIAQPDHAGLSGDLAAGLSSSYFPPLDANVVQAIRLHDEGWAPFDAVDDGARRMQISTHKNSGARRPLSFLDMHPAQLICAWRDSIRLAEETSAIGGILVSEHFSRLAESRLRMANDSLQDSKNLRDFLRNETGRRCRLTASNGTSGEEIRTLVDVLQFCDLLSLYLCCGASEEVEFPQQFQGHTILLRREGQMYRTEPAIFGAGVSLGVSARRHPPSREELNFITMGFLLA